MGIPFGLGSFKCVCTVCECVKINVCSNCYLVPSLCPSLRKALKHKIHSILVRRGRDLLGDRAEREKVYMKKELTSVRVFCMLGVLDTHFFKFQDNFKRQI